MDRLNKTPGEAHGCDFSRVKPFYLDGKSALLRQSILLSAYETPEMRALYSKTLVNVGGKVKAETFHEGVLTNVPSGIKQVFTRFETPDVWAEDDARFEHFTTKVRPTPPSPSSGTDMRWNRPFQLSCDQPSPPRKQSSSYPLTSTLSASSAT